MEPSPSIPGGARTDALGFERCLRSIRAYERDLAEARGLFANAGDGAAGVLSPGERRTARSLFSRVVDYQVVLGALAARHGSFWDVDPTEDPAGHVRAFALGSAAHGRALALALAFVDRASRRPELATLLDEPCDGLPALAFDRLRSFATESSAVLRLAGARQLDKVYSVTLHELVDRVKREPGMRAVLADLSASYAEVKALLLDRGPGLFASSALEALKSASLRAVFPVQVEVARFLGHTRVRSEAEWLIAPAQIAEARALLRPGDLLVQRRNWYLSNLGLPGFWPHAALWIGAPGELRSAFDDDPEVTAALGGRMTEVLAARFPETWRRYSERAPDDWTGPAGAPRVILEAIGEGVVFTTAERSFSCDYAAGLRPRLPPPAVAQAIARAFELAGLPYDFDFDLASDRALFCSELIHRAYEVDAGERGLRFPATRVMGRTTLVPNALVAHYDERCGSAGVERELEFVFFLDGSETLGRATFQGEAELRRSHLRSKWDFAQD